MTPTRGTPSGERALMAFRASTGMTGDREMSETTLLLLRWNEGDDEALSELVPRVESELRRLARGYLRAERMGHSLQATDLVNEAYVRLIDQHGRSWNNRAHFVGMAARIMRQILIDHARKRRALKRGGDAGVVLFDEALDLPLPAELDAADLLTVHDALQRLEALDPRQSRIVELRVFGGLSHHEIAEVTGVSVATVKREWQAAKAWLYGQLAGG